MVSRRVGVSEGVGIQYLMREMGVGVLLGVLYGALLGAYAMVAYGGSDNVLALAVTVGISILASMAMSATVGAITPLMFERLRIDPAVPTDPL